MKALQKTLQQFICIINSFCIFTHYPDHGSSGIWFIQGIQILTQGGNDAFIPDSSEYTWITRVNSTYVYFISAHNSAENPVLNYNFLYFYTTWNKQHFQSIEDTPRLFPFPIWVSGPHRILKGFAVSLISKATQKWYSRQSCLPFHFAKGNVWSKCPNVQNESVSDPTAFLLSSD